MVSGANPRASWLARILHAVALVLLFVVSLATSTVLHVNLPAARRAIERAANDALAGLQSGSVRLTGLERVTFDRIEVGAVDVDVADVGRFHGEFVRVTFDALRTVRAALFEKHVTAIRVQSAEVAFVGAALRYEAKPAPPPESPPTEVRLDVDRIAVEHAYVSGRVASVPPLDVDLDQVRGALSLDAASVRITFATRATARALLPGPIDAAIEGSMVLPLSSAPIETQSGSLDVVASTSGVRVDGHGVLHGDAVDVELVVPETPADALKGLWEEAPLVAPLSARARFGGTLPHLDAHVDLNVGHCAVAAKGRVDLVEHPSADLALVGREIDLRAFAEGAPSSRLGFDARAHLSVAEAKTGEIPLDGWIAFSRLDGSIEREPVPRVEGRISIEPSAQRLIATVEEEGAALSVEAIRTSGGLIEGTLEGTAPSLAEVPRLARHGLPATGRAVVRADVSVEGNVIASEAVVDVYRAGFANVGVGAARLEARIDGPIDALRASAFLHLIALRREPYAVNDVLLSANGTPSAFEVSLAGRGGTFDVVAVQADVSWRDVIEIAPLSARVDRDVRSLALRADKVEFGRSSSSAEGVHIEGCGGQVALDARRAAGSISATVAAPAFDLGCIAQILDISPERLGGRGSMSLSVELDPRHSTAEGHLDVSGAKLGVAPEFDATVDFGLDGREVRGLAVARNSTLGGVRLEAAGTLGGSLLDTKALAASTGRVDFATDRLVFERLCSVLPCSEGLRGAVSNTNVVVEARAVLERQAVRGETGDARIHLNALARDSRGPLAHLDLSSTFDLGRLLETKSLSSDSPLEGEFGIEERAIDELPPTFRPDGVSGRVATHAYAQGTIGKPFFAVEVDGIGMRYGNPFPGDSPLDVRWVTTYDLEEAASEIHVTAGSRRVIDGVVQLDASLERLLSGDDKSWNGGAYVSLDRFPLSSVPLEVGERMTGSVSGTISAAGLHRQPRIEARLSIDELAVGRALAGPVAITVDADEQRCVATVVSGNPGRGSADTGSASLHASTTCAWKEATWPTLDPRAPAQISFDATRFQLGVVAPLITTWIERMKGRLDAHLQVVGAPANGMRAWAIRGEAHVREGNMLPLEIGREFKQLQIDAKADGGVVTVERLTGDVGAGHFDGTASILLRGLSIERGRAELHVPKRRAIPMTAEGVSYGTVWGDVFAEANVVDNTLQIHLRAPTLRAELPPQTTATLESLKDSPSVVVLQPLGPEKPESAVGGGPSPGALSEGVVISLELGDNVGISRDDMKIELTTPAPPANPKVILDGELRVDGSIRILGGRVPVAGRVFRVERGIVNFSGNDPADPALDIDAVYDSADASGTRIDVHVRGTAKNVKLSLTSSPPKSESELLSILAFGEPMPGTGSQASGMSTPGTSTGAAAGAGAAAAGVGSAILTSGINQLLSQSVIPIRTRVATGATPLAAASVDLTERIRVEYIRQFGNIRYGQPQDVNQFALDWRFRPRWILRTVVGDRGTTTVDILWNRWY